MPRRPKEEMEDDGLGHNGGPITAAHLRQFIEKIERLNEEAQIINEDIREIFGEAKANGFYTKIMRQVIKRRKLEAADLEEQDSLVELYEGALAGRIAEMMA